jgi:histone H3/H4
MSYDDDDEGPPLRVPRLSLPIDEDDDGDLPRPHRSAGLEDENFTMQSIEFGRRAYSEQPVRSSLGGQRLSDVYGQAFDAGGGMRDDDVGVDSAFFPPLHAIDEDAAAGLEEEVEYEMIEAEDRTALGRESDFGLVVPPPEENESTFVIQPEVGSPTENEPFGMEEEESHVHFADDVVGGDEEEQDGEQLEEEIEAEAEAEELEMETDAAKARSAAVAKARKKKKAGVKVSKYGIQYPSLPPAVVKRLAQTFAKTSGVKGKIAPDTLAAIMQASDWFFEQLGDDLQAYSKHAGRKTIDESDVLQLMRRYVTFYTRLYTWVSFCALEFCKWLTRSAVDSARPTPQPRHSP